jgi:hypothetical protein
MGARIAGVDAVAARAHNARLLSSTQAPVMTRNPLLILLNRQRASAGRVRLPFAIDGVGSN